MQGLVAARTAVLGAIMAIDADIRRMVRASADCRRLMTIPGVGQLTALAFTAAIDDHERFRRSREIGAYFGLVPRRYQPGEVDYTGSISKCGDRRVRTLLYEAANVMLTRYRGTAEAQGLGPRDRQTIDDAQGADRARPSSGHHHARDTETRHRVQTGVTAASTGQEVEPSSRAERRPREGADDGADFVACGKASRLRFQPSHSARS